MIFSSHSAQDYLVFYPFAYWWPFLKWKGRNVNFTTRLRVVLNLASWIITFTSLWGGRPRNCDSILGGGERFLSSLKVFEQLWDWPKFSGYWEVFPRGSGERGLKLIPHLQLVPSLKMCGALPPLLLVPLWRAQRQLSLAKFAVINMSNKVTG
jgi:hypothetical protein